MLSDCKSKLQVFLRVIQEGNTGQYPLCLEVMSSRAVTVVSSPMPLDEEVQAFEKKSKLAYSPTSHVSPPLKQESANVFAQRSQTPQKRKEKSFTFDHVFSEIQGTSHVSREIRVDLSKNQCVLSVGSSESGHFQHTILRGLLEQAFQEGFSVKISCIHIQSGTVSNVIEGTQIIRSLNESESFYNPEFYSAKVFKEAVFVTTCYLFKEKESVLQFVEVNSLSYCESLETVLTNSDFPRHSSIIVCDKLIESISRSIGASFSIIGNVRPTAPHSIATEKILKFLNHVYENKHKTKTSFLTILSKENERLVRLNIAIQQENEKLKLQLRRLEEDIKTHNSKIRLLEDENSKMMCDKEKTTEEEPKSLKDQVYWLKQLNLMKIKELNTAKEKLKEPKIQTAKEPVLNRIDRSTQTETYSELKQKTDPTTKEKLHFEFIQMWMGFTEAIKTDLTNQMTRWKEMYYLRCKDYLSRLTRAKNELENVQKDHLEILQHFKKKDAEINHLNSHVENLRRENEELKNLNSKLNTEFRKLKSDAKKKIDSRNDTARDLKQRLKEATEKNTKDIEELNNQFEREKGEMVRSLNLEKEQLMHHYETEKKNLEAEISTLKLLRRENPSKKRN